MCGVVLTVVGVGLRQFRSMKMIKLNSIFETGVDPDWPHCLRREESYLRPVRMGNSVQVAVHDEQRHGQLGQLVHRYVLLQN